MRSSAFSVALFMATMRLDSSLALLSSTAWKRRGGGERGRRGARTPPGGGPEEKGRPGGAAGPGAGPGGRQPVQLRPLGQRGDEDAVDDVHSAHATGQVLVHDQAGQRRDVAEGGPIAEAAEGGEDRGTGAAHGGAAPASRRGGRPGARGGR